MISFSEIVDEVSTIKFNNFANNCKERRSRLQPASAQGDARRRWRLR